MLTIWSSFKLLEVKVLILWIFMSCNVGGINQCFREPYCLCLHYVPWRCRW